MGSIRVTGFKELERELKKIEQRVNSISGEVSFDKLFTESFMTRHTKFSSFDELLAAGGYKVESQEDFEAIPDDEFDELIRTTTDFDDWKEMQSAAATEYVAKKLGL